MHHSPLGADARTDELLRLVGALASPEQRESAAVALARLLGGEGLLLFAPDPELDVLLPAPGLTQVLRGAAEWRDFLQACAREGELSGRLPGRDGSPVEVQGCALSDGTAAVLLEPDPNGPGPAPLRPLLPLLGALFRTERQVSADVVRARSAADAVERANVLTRALQEMRQRLETALVEAQQARSEARQRAEQAEGLAAELQVQAERLRMQAAELETLNDELISRTEDAERARSAADEANRAKSEFLANMSHELRTPINAVIGYAELLNLGIAGPVTQQQQAQLERIRASSAHLLSLVNDVLDLAKVEAGRMSVEHERQPVSEVITEALALVEMQAQAKQLKVENECRDAETMYVGDRDRVRQVLVNLLSNAVKFTEPPGQVTLRGGTTDQPDESAQVTGDGPWTYITVEDTGIGMSPEQLSRVFRPFVQAESGHTRTRGGTGLGLTISRQLARLMGGDLTVRSEAGEGSSFTLWLPSVSPAQGALDPSIRVGSSGGGEPFPDGLARAGAILQERLPSLTASYARRLREELPASAVESMDESELLDQIPVLITDLAGVLKKLGRFGGDSSILRNGSAVQRLVAEEHGAERGRRGWTSRLVRREFDILREELVAVVRNGAREVPEMEVPGVVRVLERLVEAVRRASLRSHGAAVIPAGPTEEIQAGG